MSGLAMGPIYVSLSRGSPYLSCWALSIRRALNSQKTISLTIILFGPLPSPKTPFFTTISTAEPRSASSRTIIESLDPKCSAEGLRSLPAIAATSLPASVEPVKLAPATWLLLSISAVFSLSARHCWYSPDSKPAATMRLSTSLPTAGVDAECLARTQLPSRSWGSERCIARQSGEVKGRMQRTEPVGTYLTSVFFLAVALTFSERIPSECLPQYSHTFAACRTSLSAAQIGLPVSKEISLAISSLLLSICGSIALIMPIFSLAVLPACSLKAACDLSRHF